MDKCRISLIIPAYNEEKYLASCIEHALENSEGKLHEIIVVDNASTDSTNKIAASFPAVKVVLENNKGVSYARERGYLESKGNILAFIDADTRMSKGWIDKIINEFRNEKLASLSGPYTYYDISKVKNFFYWWCLWMPTYLTYLVTRRAMIAGNSVIRRSILEQMSGFDTTIIFYGDDVDTAIRASKFGKVKFSLGFIMPSSARRWVGEGVWYTAFKYTINYFWVFLFNKPKTKGYTEVR